MISDIDCSGDNLEIILLKSTTGYTPSMLFKPDEQQVSHSGSLRLSQQLPLAFRYHGEPSRDLFLTFLLQLFSPFLPIEHILPFPHRVLRR